MVGITNCSGSGYLINFTPIKENKMNKVYEGILVKVEDGEMTDAYSVETTLAGSPQRARDNFVREFGDTITDLEDNGFDWDIIVREFK